MEDCFIKLSLLVILSLFLEICRGEYNGRNVGDLPKFIEQPKRNYYIVRDKDVTIRCKAKFSKYIRFKCGKNWRRDVENVQLNDMIHQSQIRVTKQQVKSYFGDSDKYRDKYTDKYKCQCYAWKTADSKDEEVLSTIAYVQIAYLQKRFQRDPIRQRVHVNENVKLTCLPPKGLPPPTVFWMKDSVEIDVQKDKNFIIASEGDLLISQVRLSDAGEYNCGAQNSFNRRTGPPALLEVYVDGSWSSWTQWTPCSSICGKGIQRRSRKCNNPPPQNNGSKCRGDPEQKLPCMKRCPVSGQWGEWLSWSTCNTECMHYRRRECNNPAPQHGGHHCVGTDFYNKNCTGGECKDRTHYMPLDSMSSRKGYTSHQNKQNGVSKETSPSEDDDNIALYIGICVGFCLIVIVIVVIVFFTVRRKHLPNQHVTNVSQLGEEEQMKLNIQKCQVVTTTQPDLMSNMGTLRSQSSTISSRHNANNNHIDVNLDKVPIYTEISQQQHRLSSLASKNSSNPILDGGYCTSHSSRGSSGQFITRDKSSPNNVSPEMRPLISFQNGDVPHLPHHVAMLPRNLNTDYFVSDVFDYRGGRLTFDPIGITLTVPFGAIEEGCKEQIYLGLCHDIEDSPKLSDRQTLLSPVVVIGPPTVMLQKPVILSSPHCAIICKGGWVISVYSDVQDFSNWRRLLTLGQETINTPVYTQLDKNKYHLMTDQLQSYVLVGESAFSKSGIKELILMAFATVTQSSIDFSIRVYVVDHTYDALECICKLEEELGGQALDDPRPFQFQDGGNNLCLSIEDVSPGWRTKPAASYQEIPFHHIWRRKQMNLHCSFSLELVNENSCSMCSCHIKVYQKSNLTSGQCIVVNRNLKEMSPIVPMLAEPNVAKSFSPVSNGINGHYMNTMEMIRLTPHVRNQLCRLLDTPNPRGNDWRMLAQALTVDRYINFFATKSSPTEHILDLWEARHREQSALTDLMNILRVIGRLDAASVLENEVGPWV